MPMDGRRDTGQRWRKGGRNVVKRKFAKLKGLMLETGITQEEAARIMGRSKTYLSYRLNSRESFTFEDAAKL